MPKKITTDDFIKKAKAVHGDKYDYSQSEYMGSKIKVKIICPIHGVFEQTPKNHLAGAGCQICAGRPKVDTDLFIEQARKVHGNKYDYSKVDYQSTHKNVSIICPIHGVFEQTPHNHLCGKGCQICAGNKRRLLNDFIDAANDVHDFKYSYDKTNYKNDSTHVVITCNEHGDFMQSPGKHLSGRGCPKCGLNIVNSTSELLLYDKLVGVFGVNDVIRHFKSDEYPFNCDFYILSRNMYIELNAFGGHGHHWYSNSDVDKDVVLKWQQGSTEKYNNMINTWIVSDVLKRNTAKENNLNYVVFWNSNLWDANLWFDLGCPDGMDWNIEYSWLIDCHKNLRYSCENVKFIVNNFSKIVKSYQFTEFYKFELKLWNENPIIKRSEQMCRLHDFLYINRHHYLGKLPFELSDAEILRGFSISGILRGYTVFDAKLMCQVLDDYDIKSVYDPCAGWGERMLAAAYHNVTYLGVDINEHLADGYTNMIADYRLMKQNFVCNDAAKYVPKFNYDAVITCPPYGSIEKYTNVGAENLEDDEFYDWWNIVVANATKVKPKYFCFQINTKYRNKMADIVCNYGYVLHDELFFKSNKSSHFTRKSGGQNLKKSKESMLVFVRK